MMDVAFVVNHCRGARAKAETPIVRTPVFVASLQYKRQPEKKGIVIGSETTYYSARACAAKVVSRRLSNVTIDEFLSSKLSPVNGWSTTFSPTDGRSTLTGIPSCFRIVELPMPESSRSLGLLIALWVRQTTGSDRNRGES